MVQSLGDRMNGVARVLGPCRSLLLFLERTSLGVVDLLGDANQADVEKLAESLKADCSARNLHDSLPTGDDARCAAACLVALLSELPESLIPMQLHSRLTAAIQLPEKRFQLSAIKAVLARVPTTHYELLKHIAYFLSLFKASQRWNKANFRQLVETFTPFMIPPNPENPEEVGLRIHLADMLVTEFLPLFKDSTREPSKEALARGRRASVQALLKPCSARDSGTGCSTSISERECEIAKYRKHMMTADLKKDEVEHFPGARMNLKQVRTVREWIPSRRPDVVDTIGQAKSTIDDILSMLE